MAAITTTASTQATVRIRTGTAQANTGQTDWVSVPRWARYMTVFLNMTASAGTTPGPTLVHLKVADPIVKTDTNLVSLYTMTTGLTNTGLLVLEAGPGLTGIADVTAASARGTFNGVLPPIIGINTVLSRTDGDETYTYTLDVAFRW